MTYRTREEVVEHRKDDPVPRFERLLDRARRLRPRRRRGDEERRAARDQRGHRRAEAMPYPEPSDLYTHLYEGAWQPWQ